MKRMLKKIGKIFIKLQQKQEKDIRQTVLLVDGIFMLPNNLVLIIRGVQKRFTNARIAVLTFKEKKQFIAENFPDIEIIIPTEKKKARKYPLAAQLFLLLIRRRFSFVILSSLDISILMASLVFSRCPVFLHNRWLEWYKIRYKTILDVLLRARSADNKNNIKRIWGIKDRIKSLGRFFVILCNVTDTDVTNPVLVVDNGYTDIGHVSTAVRKSMANILNPDITVLTFSLRKHYFIDMFPQAKVICADDIVYKYALAMHMLRLRKYRFTHVVLTTLDISPIIITLLFMGNKVLLYNKWHEWWALKFRGPFDYIRVIVYFLITVLIFIYLFITSSFILIKTWLRSGRCK